MSDKTEEQLKIEAHVKALICEQLAVEEEKLVPETSFQDLGADSLDIVELIMAMEEEYNLTISDEEAPKLATVGDVIRYVTEHSQKTH